MKSGLSTAEIRKEIRRLQIKRLLGRKLNEEEARDLADYNKIIKAIESRSFFTKEGVIERR